MGEQIAMKGVQNGLNLNKTSKGVFPRISLKKTLELAKQIYELGGGDPVPRLVVFDKLGKSPDSGPSRMLVTTSNSYGLTTGGYQAERLGITDNAREYFETKDENTRIMLATQILLNNELFSKFFDKYKNKTLPDVAVATDFLKLNGLIDAEAKLAYAVFYENLNDYGFIKQLSGKAAIMPIDVKNEVASVKGSGLPESVEKVNDSVEKKESPQLAPKISTKLGVVPQFNFNIQVQLPENATPEVYDAIFKSIAEHLLKQQSE
jgi:hypothetical protein